MERKRFKVDIVSLSDIVSQDEERIILETGEERTGLVCCHFTWPACPFKGVKLSTPAWQGLPDIRLRGEEYLISAVGLMYLPGFEMRSEWYL